LQGFYNERLENKPSDIKNSKGKLIKMENRQLLENYLKESRSKRLSIISVADRFLEQMVCEEKRKSRFSKSKDLPMVGTKTLNLKPIRTASRTLRELNGL